ncbi:pre-mRNA 3' end processing protein WDR33 isoform X2 [Mastomys coucha]|uniref:pre-mRNA 3' end processing protein WDR33 isoform X2 n=1 Tax=Mastomys coucha TaxID=35658 RepID=UPI001262A9EF|nr:pre-mRNA 3' end processing protein WDR33 isoform X2 [Mastomys coucha]
MATEIGSPPRFFHMPRFQHQAPRQLFYKRPDFAQQQAMQQLTFDGKRMRKAVNRKTIDYNPSVIKYLENRIWQRDQRDMRAIQPDAGYYNDLVPPIGMLNNPMNAVTTKFVRTSTNKVKCPVFVVRWTPEGRRLVTGASSGEFTLWNGLTFNFETILQAHDSPVRAMTWSHNDMWMLTADHGGYVKYWQSNMNNVKMFQAHKEAIREASFSPTDNKFATCSDDGTVRIWDFLRCHEERILRDRVFLCGAVWSRLHCVPLGPSYLTFSVLLLSSLALREGKAPTHGLSLRKGTALTPLISFYVCFFLCFQLWSLLINLKPPLQRFFYLIAGF